MIKEVFGTGETVVEATEKAKAELNAPEDADVVVEVVEQPKKKTLGLFGGSPAKVRAYYEYEEDKFTKVKAYITVILENLGIEESEITVKEEGEDLRISISCGDDYGSVIGRRGETLDAIQYLVRLVVNRDHDEYKHVSINVGNYREKREATLRTLAKKNASKVRKYGRNVVLEPMNPYERRIIHTTIQEIEGVTSHSVGSDDDRKVVITLEDGVKPLNGGNGGYNKGRGGYNKKRGGKSYDNYSAPAAPSREPRKDFSGSLYGKIEAPKSED
ncbi:MAG: protein jag [Clostridia bacterium]|nr:protein jag [Clostridia bacterium]